MFTQDKNGRYHDATTGRFVSNATVLASGNYSSGSGSGSNSGYGSSYGSAFGSSYGTGYGTTSYGTGYGNTYASSNASSYLTTSSNSNSAVNYKIDRNGRAHDPTTGRYVSNSVLSQPSRESVYATPSPPAAVKTQQQNTMAPLSSLDYKIDRNGRAHDPTTGRYVSKAALASSSASSQSAPVKTHTPSEKLPTSASPKSQTSYIVDAKGRAHDAVTGRYVSQSVLSQPQSVNESATRSPSRTTPLEPSSVEKKQKNKSSATLQSSYTIDAKGRAHDTATGRYISQSVLSQSNNANVKATSPTSSLAKNYSTPKNPTSPPSQISYKIDAKGRYHDSVTGRFISRASIETANSASVTPSPKIKMSTNSNEKTPAKYVKGTKSNQMSENVGEKSVRRSLAPELEAIAKNAPKQVDLKLKDSERPRDRWGRYVRYSDHKNNSSLPAPEKNSAPPGLKDPRPRDKLGRFAAYVNNPYRQPKTSHEESLQQNHIQGSHQETQDSEFDWLNGVLQPTHEQYNPVRNNVYPEWETFAEANNRENESFAEINYPKKKNYVETSHGYFDGEDTESVTETETESVTETEIEWTEWADFSEKDEKNGYTFKIIVENKIVFVNPFALAAYSPYFKELLFDDENELKEKEMRLENDLYEDVIELLRCLFDDKPVEVENVAMIICLAKYYEVNALTALCIKFIDSEEFDKQDINLDDVIVMLSSEFQLSLSQAVKSKLIKRVNAFSFTPMELQQQLKEIGLSLPPQIFRQCV